jgi:hypothetical protein
MLMQRMMMMMPFQLHDVNDDDDVLFQLHVVNDDDDDYSSSMLHVMM